MGLVTVVEATCDRCSRSQRLAASDERLKNWRTIYETGTDPDADTRPVGVLCPTCRTDHRAWVNPNGGT